MMFAKVRRQWLLGVVGIALAAGVTTQTYAADNLLQQVKQRGTLIVGLEGTYPPFSFQGEDGKLTGFEVDFANALAEHLGVKAKLNPTKWDGMLASLDSKRIDVVINQVTLSDERKKKYDFSTPYTVSGIQALVKKGNEGTITKPELQAGGIGLLNAVERYDALQGTAFTTYAVQRIRGAMLDELRSRDWVPRSVRRHAREVAQVMRQLEQRYGRPASETEVAQTLNISLDEYRQILLDTNNSQLFSYDEWREEHGENAEPMLEGHEEANPLHHLLEGSLRQRVIDAIEALPEREKMVLTLYYQEELNLKEIGAVLDVGESRVSQLHSQAIKRLRARLANDT